MKVFLKRYKVFILLLLIQVLLLFTMPDLGKSSLVHIKDNVIEMMKVIPPIFVLLGLLDVWVDRQTMIRLTGKGSGIKGFIISLALGAAAAGPLYAAFPVAVVMRNKGSSLFNIFVFLGAWSTAKIPLLTFEAANLGMKFMISRLCLSLIGIVVIATLVNLTVNEADLPILDE